MPGKKPKDKPAAAAASTTASGPTAQPASGAQSIPAATPAVMNVEELIGISFGSHLENTVNFKMLQTILHILARQMRLLEQQVEIKFPDIDEEDDKKKNLKVEKPTEKAEKPKEKAEKPKETVEKPKEKVEKSKQEEKEESDSETEIEVKEKTKDKTKEKAKAEKQKEELEKEQPKSKKDKKQGSINVTDNKGVIVVEKVPPAPSKSKIRDLETIREQRARVGSIEVVTWSQFDLLEQKVKTLLLMKGPVSQPQMPESKELKSQIAQGTASLTDTMDAMKLDARIQAAEKAISKMAGLLTAMAVSGSVSTGASKDIEMMMGDLRELGVPIENETELLKQMKKTVEKKTPDDETDMAHVDMPVTHSELSETIVKLEFDLEKNIMNTTAKALTSAEQARNLAANTASKLELTLNLKSRIDTLYSLTNDYVEQLKGFDTGLTTQLMSFQEQMLLMKSELRESLSQLDISNNAESAAITELRQAYETITGELDQIFHEHSILDFTQKQLTEELKRLTEWVEMLREQKADRDEVADGLRDKADILNLKGLLSEEIFDRIRRELEKRLELCYEKFQQQDNVWLTALKDLSVIADGKSEVMQLLMLRDQTTESLKQMSELLQRLEIMLGEPKTALLTRRLARDATCGACSVRALMTLEDENTNQPVLLPRYKLRSMPKEEPCARDIDVLAPPDPRKHICKRWVGGSHTLLNEYVVRESREASRKKESEVPVKRYVGTGTDGKLYYFEEEVLPCVECATSVIVEKDDLSTTVPSVPEVGGGDQGLTATDDQGDKTKPEQDIDNKETVIKEENYPDYIT